LPPFNSEKRNVQVSLFLAVLGLFIRGVEKGATRESGRIRRNNGEKEVSHRGYTLGL